MCLADRLHSRWVLLAYSHRWRDWRDAGGAVERLRMVDLADPQPRRREQQRPDGRFVRSADRLHRCRRLLPDLRGSDAGHGGALGRRELVDPADPQPHW